MKIKYHRSIVILLATGIVCAVALSLRAQDAAKGGPGESETRFKWSFEDGGSSSVQARPSERIAGVDTVRPAQPAAISAEAYDKIVKENLRLRKEAEALQKACDDSRKINGDLVDRVKAMETKAQQPAESVSVASAKDLAKAREENVALQLEITRLRETVVNLQKQTQTDPGVPPVSTNSDLFKQLVRDNAVMRQELQKQKQAVKETGDEERRASTAVDESKKLVKDLNAENAVLKRLVLDQQAKARGAVDAMDKLAKSELELKKVRIVLALKEREWAKIEDDNKERFSKLAKDEKETAEFLKERTDLLFNLGVMYTRAGMHRDAEKMFLKMLQVQPNAADVHYSLGILYDKNLGNKSKAQTHYKRFIELDPLSKDVDKVKLWLLELEMGGERR